MKIYEKEIYEEFMDACDQNNVGWVVHILKENPGIDLDVIEHAYILSCGWNYVDIVKELIKVPGIDINAKNKIENYDCMIGTTALIEACLYNSYAVIKELLGLSDIDINCKDNDGNTPLITLCEFNDNYNTETLQLLLGNPKIYINEPSNFLGRSAFFDICSGPPELYKYNSVSSIKIIREFLKNKDLDYNKHDEIGRTPLGEACNYSHVEIVEELLKLPLINYNIMDQQKYFYTNEKKYLKCIRVVKDHMINDISLRNCPLHYDIIKKIVDNYL